MNIGGFLRRNGVTIVVGGCLFTLGGSILFPFFASARYFARRSDCQTQLRAIAMACQQYRADYDGRYPPLSDGGPRGWSVLIQKDRKTLDFSCAEGAESSFSPTSDYFFNARLAIRQASSIRDPESTISFGDGPDNGPTNSHYWELPNDGENPDSVLIRHLYGSNYAFADGHVKFESPARLNEWGEDETGSREWHSKFSPDEKAWRFKAPRKMVSPTPDAQTKRLHDLVHAARSFDKTN